MGNIFQHLCTQLWIHWLIRSTYSIQIPNPYTYRQWLMHVMLAHSIQHSGKNRANGWLHDFKMQRLKSTFFENFPSLRIPAWLCHFFSTRLYLDETILLEWHGIIYHFDLFDFEVQNWSISIADRAWILNLNSTGKSIKIDSCDTLWHENKNFKCYLNKMSPQM